MLLFCLASFVIVMSLRHALEVRRSLCFDAMPEKKAPAASQSLLQWFVQSTTIGGLTQLGNANRMSLAKPVWLILFIIGAGFTIWNVQEVVKDYLRNEVSYVRFA